MKTISILVLAGFSLVSGPRAQAGLVTLAEWMDEGEPAQVLSTEFADNLWVSCDVEKPEKKCLISCGKSEFGADMQKAFTRLQVADKAVRFKEQELESACKSLLSEVDSGKTMLVDYECQPATEAGAPEDQCQVESFREKETVPSEASQL